MFNFEGALLRSRRFYALPTLEDTTEDFLTGELDGYVLRRGEYWTSYRLVGTDISPQGWKVHISPSPSSQGRKRSGTKPRTLHILSWGAVANRK